ncbi:hypothetical protein [Sporolactobacillus vineae]|uniref:hypothetical protein n=1 Tax=Sporolactobacillus vineae TaxID=444463 RepID=UPI000288D852|nr:hypothetical protein [Sporolactobacillus vineae]
MGVLIFQLLLSYGAVGTLMGLMLGLIPFWRRWKKEHFAAFCVILVLWLPIALLTIFAAPLAGHMLRYEKQTFD